MTRPSLDAFGAFGSLLRFARATLRRDALVDVRRLPGDLLAPIKPYLAVHNYTDEPLWQRRFQFVGIDFNIRIAGRHRFAQSELEVIYERHIRLLAEREAAVRHETAAMEAQSALDLVQAQKAFLTALSAEERALLDARLRAKAEAEAQVDVLRQQHAELWSQYESATAELQAVREMNRALQARRQPRKRNLVRLRKQARRRTRDTRGRFAKERDHE